MDLQGKEIRILSTKMTEVTVCCLSMISVVKITQRPWQVNEVPVWNIGAVILAEEFSSIRRKPDPLPLGVPYIPNLLYWE